MVDYGITRGGTITGPVVMKGAAAGSDVLTAEVTGDTVGRLVVDADGTFHWGAGGLSALDADMYRAGANQLATDGDLGAGHNVRVGSVVSLGDNGVGELQIANAATPPTTNPTGGAVLYANGGGLFSRDASGVVSSILAGGQSGGPPTGVIASTCHAYSASASATPVSGTLYIHRVFLSIGQVVSSIGFVTGLTAANGPTHWWTALLDSGYKQQAHSADQLTAALPASTWQNLSMVTPYTATYSGAYFLAVMITTSVTQPTLVSTTTVPNAALINGAGLIGPVPGGTSTAALTVPGTDNSTVYATPTAASNFFYQFAK